MGSGEKISINKDAWIPEAETYRIHRIPLAKKTHDDLLVWSDKNTRIHKRKVNKGREIAWFIVNYITEINEIDRRNLRKEHEEVKRRGPSGYAIKINFDSAYDGRNYRLALGIVARNAKR
ncbi:hypothetical protein PVK06_036313 [Gossypium arboreum]|uniref:Uncharacterized protein n=1 Tax=Gossypium arboreum TaxID=29729 RepID=A0ABR0NJ77_GOSAR|nr:hypothetical protein PVK06_036313 [Gossypium arboreum]